jgi:uncharacterized protein (DUF362 family)
MVIARGGDSAGNVRVAAQRVGGPTALVTPADLVVIEPNIGWERPPEQGASTHPEVVAEVVRLCRAAGARRVIVSDRPERGSRKAFERSGIPAAAAPTSSRCAPSGRVDGYHVHHYRRSRRGGTFGTARDGKCREWRT